MPEMIIKKDKLLNLLEKLKADRLRVIAPAMRQNTLIFAEIETTEEIVWDGINTRLSLKGYFLPRCEPILKYRIDKQKVEVNTLLGENIHQSVIFGAHPCDAASLPIMDKVFNWDFVDEYWNRRRAATTVIALSCLDCDYACFCTSLGLDPAATKGSDILLTPAENDAFLVEINSEKGQRLIDTYKEFFAQGSADKDKILAPVRRKLGKKFELTNIQPWHKENFFNEFWERETLYCIGCGICTFVCPTCHCYDIVDEGSLFCGSRMKFWDACQFRTFTLHASGHNPRSRQDERHRQRIQHKFNYYPEKFGETLCTGCGRCVRYCPVDLSILRLLTMISEMQQGKISANI